MTNTKHHATKVKVSVNEVATFVELRERRLTLQREADALSKIEATVAAKLIEAVRANRSAPLRKGGYVLSLVDGAGRPSWKDEFIRVAGEAAAAVVSASAPRTTKLNITGV